MKLKCYLAGPDLFLSDRVERKKKLFALCDQYGFEGIWPGDNEDLNPSNLFAGCIEGINKSDFVIANITPFRGINMDPGTAFEIGYCYAARKGVICYTEDTDSLKTRVKNSIWYDEDEILEDFGLPENLMICKGSLICAYSMEDAFKLANINFK